MTNTQIYITLGAAMFVAALLIYFQVKYSADLKRELASQPDIIGEHEVYQIRRQWDDGNAKLTYQLCMGEAIELSDGREFMNKSHNQGARWCDEEGWRVIGSGDLAWAERTAKHYDIKVPSEGTPVWTKK